MSEHEEDTARTINVCRFVPPMNDGFQMVRPGELVDPKVLSAMDSAESSEPDPVPTVMDNVRVPVGQHQAARDMMSGSPRLKPVPEDQLVTGGPAAATIPAGQLEDVPITKHPDAIEFPEVRKEIVIEEPEPVATSPEPSPEPEKSGRSEKQRAHAAKLAAANKARAEARRRAKSEESAPADKESKEPSEEDIF